MHAVFYGIVTVLFEYVVPSHGSRLKASTSLCEKTWPQQASASIAWDFQRQSCRLGKMAWNFKAYISMFETGAVTLLDNADRRT